MISITRKWHIEWFAYVITRATCKNDWKNIVENENFIPDFIVTHPQYMSKWDWYAIGNNPNLTIHFILDHPEFADKWDWKSISANKNITPSVVTSIPSIKWDWVSISLNPSILSDTAFLTDNLSKLRLDYVLPNAPIDFIRQHFLYFESQFPEYRIWNWLSGNPNITTDFLVENLEKPWHWGTLTANSAIPAEFIETNLQLGWDWHILSVHKMTVSFYHKYEHLFTDMVWISLNKNMIELIYSHPEKDWDWGHVSNNDGLTMHLIETFPDKPWDWHSISQHPNITQGDITRHPDLPWSWFAMSSNINISIACKAMTDSYSYDEHTTNDLSLY